MRHLGGVTGQLRQLWGNTDLRNQSCGEGISDKGAGIPYGHRPPSSWCLAYTSGALSAFTNCNVTFSVGELNLAAGRNLNGDATVTVTVGPSLLELIVSAEGSSVVSFTVSGNVVAALSMTGSSSLSFTVGPSTLGAIIDAIASSQVTFSNSATMNATGNISGSVSPFTELSPENLAAAVWNAIAAEYNNLDTMGYVLNNSGGGGGGGATAAQIWSYATRTLTASPGPSASTIASQVRTELTTELNRIDTSVSSRLASASYTAPPTAVDIRAEIDANSTKLDATISSRALETTAQAIKTSTDNIPASPATQAKVQEAVDAAKLAAALSA